MDLITQLQQISSNVIKNLDFCDLTIGTVTNEDVLEIEIASLPKPLKKDQLLLTEGVVEKKLILKKHKHKIKAGLLKHNHGGLVTQSGAIPNDLESEFETELEFEKVDFFEHEKKIDTEEKDETLIITINNKLKNGDKVLMLKVSNGQQFIILSRIFEHLG